ncbi:LPS export ABC transporter periplasmic protein LptC [Rosenbergiella australiborealis]|uniref:Lipopolysaccharide export system protein LptC n=1 Tax=Rosenbergiella australiborealis TaxID=1544696 RepID=A0ABS5T0H6_9GAMM|nr:LPS export ABC transporter periplasmic protein LptC [Rosenbergiella australiborealis]MBT0725834.1 LPS export ABC transporter periplasmic protein LptC [Rosenbergiella australiborealis]
MSNARKWITGLLAIIALALIGWNLTSSQNKNASTVVNDQSPTYTSETSKTTVYNPQGALTYRLVSQQVEYFDTQQLTWFTQPVLTTFDDTKRATWVLTADKAKLTQDRMLYLYGHVVIQSQLADSRLQRVTTDTAQVNLVTQDVTSNDSVTLKGIGFESNGMKLRGNLRAKTAELLEKVNTSYEIQK